MRQFALELAHPGLAQDELTKTGLAALAGMQLGTLEQCSLMLRQRQIARCGFTLAVAECRGLGSDVV